MRPPELLTKTTVVEDRTLPDGLLVEYGAEAGIVTTAPGEAPEICKRLELWPELVEVTGQLCEAIRLQKEGLASDRPSPMSIAVAAKLHTVEAILARCKEVPND